MPLSSTLIIPTAQIQISGDLPNPVFLGVTVSNTTDTNAEITYMDFVGSFSPVSFTANDRTRLFLGAANSLYYPNEAMDVGSCRAYFQLKGGLTAGCLTAGENASGVRAFNLNFGGDDATV